MTGVVLAAGLGRRLQPITDRLPKALVKIGDRPCLDYVLEALGPVVTEFCVVTGYRGEQIERYLARGKPGWKKIRTVRNPRPEVGSILSLGCARQLIAPSESSGFILVNADHLYPADFFVDHLNWGDEITLACQRGRPVLPDEMKVQVDSTDHVVCLSKSMGSHEGAYIGATVVPHAVCFAYWEAFSSLRDPQGSEHAVVEDVLCKLIRRGLLPKACFVDKMRWFEIDTPEDLAHARAGLA